ncbi:MAG: hypothetical protein KIT33_15585 [Candidatus Kapabacteria bacterium]|nr:hypothetical protein [Ignavibacteriota bacterium]MCW5886392.1 hypothetical protein [Candidatus Kapabacteria bacterium]
MDKRLESLRASQDPLLTMFAQKIDTASFVSNLILPEVQVEEMTGKIPVFGKEHMRIHDSERPTKAPIKTMPLDDWTTKDYGLSMYALEAQIDVLESAAAKKVTDLEKYSVEQLRHSLELQKEKAAVDLLSLEATYSADHYVGLTNDDYFNNNDSDPISTILDSMETVRGKVNRLPNAIVIGHEAFAALQSHPKILSRIQYTQTGIVTEELLSAILSTKSNPVTVRVGTGLYDNNGVMTDLWGKRVIMAYNKSLAPNGMSKYDNSFGKSLVAKGYPLAAKYPGAQPVIDNVAVMHMYQQLITNKDAGFCLYNVVGTVSEG